MRDDEDALNGAEAGAEEHGNPEADCNPAAMPAGAATEEAGQGAPADDASESVAETGRASAEGGDAPDGEEAGRRPHLRGMTRREAAFAAIAAAALVVAAACAVLYAGAFVPPDAAAQVNGSYVPESRVAEWIGQYRAANSLTSDTDFSSALAAQGKTAAAFRREAIDELARNDLVVERAAELGLSPTEEQALEQLAATKDSLSLGDDSIWADTLAMYGLSEDGLVAQYKVNLAQRAVLEAEVPRAPATDDELLSYIQGNLAGTTQKHAYRIVFDGDDAASRAQSCFDEVNGLVESGGLTVDAFADLARRYSDEEGAADTGGSYAWSGSGMDAEVKDIVEDLAAGGVSGVTEMQGGGSFAIVYCDEAYKFPAASELKELPRDVPDGLMDEVEDAAAESLWSAACKDYLAALLASAAITYYPMPGDAPYNVGAN